MDIPGFFDKLGYSTSLRRKIIIYFLIMSVLPILLLSYWAYDYGKTSTEGRVIAHLTSIADLKKSELKGWLSDRLGNLRTLSENQDIGLYLLGYDTDADGRAAGRSQADESLFSHIQSNLQSVKTNYGYRRVFVVDLSGKVVVSTEKDNIGRILNEVDLSKYLAAREVYIKDIFRSQGDDILMVFSSPIYGFDPVKRRGSPAILGILILEMDMEKTVFPMIGRWPGMGLTGETLLVRREGDEVLFLNELRHKKDSALNLRIPVDSAIAAPAIFASEGDEGILRARDYRAVEVLSAYRHIPVMDWGFVAKIDQDEAFVAVTSLRNRMIMLSSLLILAAIGLAGWISGGITRPILSLEKLTRKIARGDFSVHIEPKTKDEIGRLSTSFNQMAEELKDVEEQLVRKEKLAVLGQLAGSVSHELRNPLGIIGNSVYYLKMKFKDADKMMMKHLDILQREVERSNKLISILLDFSIATPPSLEGGDLNSMVKETLVDIEIPGNIALETQLDKDLPAILFNHNQIRQVFQNLISNAVQAMPEGGRLTIKTRAMDDFVDIMFSDTGEGITKENLPKIFEPLFTAKAKGIGLGLAIVKGIIDSHKGSIEVESAVGRGTNFTVKLPMKQIDTDNH